MFRPDSEQWALLYFRRHILPDEEAAADRSVGDGDGGDARDGLKRYTRKLRAKREK